MYRISDFKKGLKLFYNNILFEIIDFNHSKMGRNVAIIKTKLKSLKTDKIFNYSFRSNDKFKIPNINEKKVQFLYYEKSKIIFMDCDDYKQYSLELNESIKNKLNFLDNGVLLDAIFLNSEIINIVLPKFVIISIKESDFVIKGNTICKFNKNVVLNNGYILQVPKFIKVNEKIKICTKTGKYLERI